ncbi:MAG: GNAT family N-acetyltransferase [Alcanivoracaceae bacterium]|nr:GNAT family N-acetyltransferase [Alcanivoracaceae bacterium]
MKLRPVTLADARRLHDWRNDAQTRAASLSTAPVSWEDHLAWLSASLDNPARTLMIAERDGTAVGTVRADARNGMQELSWTVAPDARGQGVAKEMVLMFRATLPDKVCARVREDNMASRRIAEALGLQCQSVTDGVCFFSE